jgi:hypothetical protein
MAKSALAVWTDVQILKERVEKLEGVIVRLLDQINQMQQARKPGRKPKNGPDKD